MKIFSQSLGVAATNMYLFFDEESKKAVLFDAPDSTYGAVKQVLEQEGLTLEAVYLTHGHYDHMFDAHLFAEDGVPVYAHRDDEEMIEHADQFQKAFLGGMELKPVKVDRWIEAGETGEILGQHYEVRHVPGHCPGNILFYFKDMALAIVGDAIFAGSVGRVDLPGGDGKVLQTSIREQIFTLPGDTSLASGHGPVTTVQHEKDTNQVVEMIGYE